MTNAAGRGMTSKHDIVNSAVNRSMRIELVQLPVESLPQFLIEPVVNLLANSIGKVMFCVGIFDV